MARAKAEVPAPSLVRMIVSAIVVAMIVVVVWEVIEYRQKPPPPPHKIGERVSSD